ncbi:MAG: VWA domain-containing protein [Alphaproteobacteria bacterium]|nr:VWA domain-containing protein [Alphaproteobacteria bacterium]
MFKEFVTNFHFIRPWVLILLIIPFLYYFYVFKTNTNFSSWDKVCDKKLLNYLIIKGKSSKRKLGVFFMYLGLIGAIIAASGPSWKKHQTDMLTNQNPVMIVLNMSTDMLQTDITPNRLDRAKMKIIQLLKQLKSADSGLIVYTNEPFLVSPISSDSELVINLLDAVNSDIMPINGDRLDRAIELADEKIRAAGYNGGNIVVLTADSGMNFDLSLKTAQKSADSGYIVNIINMSKQTNDKLRQIANMGKGLYLSSSDDVNIMADTILNEKENFKIGKNKTADWLDFGWYLLAIPALCCLNFFRKGVLIIFLMFFTCYDANAGFIFSDNYLAKKDFDEKKYDKAAQTFDNQRWKGAALYKSGDFENAAKMFEGKNDIESIYNLANSLAKSGKIDEAIKLYENVLEKKSDHDDARFNLEYLKKQQGQNKNNKKQQKDNNKNQESQNKDQQKQDKQQQQNEQKSASQNEQSQDENKEKQEQNAQNMMAQAQADKEDNNKQSKDDSKENQENEQSKKTEQNVQEQKIINAAAKQGKKDEEYDEKVQAKVQKFREIPEDKGGLLREFIRQEYLKDRYGD